MPGRLALVRRPSPRLAEGEVSHAQRVPVDAELALAQWEEYVATLQRHGWRTEEVPPADDQPDGVFVEDTVVMYRNVALVARPGATVRRPEVPAVEEALTDLGCSVNWIREPGTLEGGDVLKVGDVLYAGRSSRTNGAGIAQLRAVVEPLGARVVTVPVSQVLHLKSAVTALPDGTVIGHPSTVDHLGLFPSFLAMPEKTGSAVVSLGEGRLLIAASAPRSAELLSDLGYHPVPVDISEFQKMDGCVTCLSVRVRSLYAR